MDLTELSRICDMATLNLNEMGVLPYNKYKVFILNEDLTGTKEPHFHVKDFDKDYEIKVRLNGTLMEIKQGRPKSHELNSLLKDVRKWLVQKPSRRYNYNYNIQRVLDEWHIENRKSVYKDILVSEVERLDKEPCDIEEIYNNVVKGKRTLK